MPFRRKAGARQQKGLECSSPFACCRGDHRCRFLVAASHVTNDIVEQRQDRLQRRGDVGQRGRIENLIDVVHLVARHDAVIDQ